MIEDLLNTSQSCMFIFSRIKKTKTKGKYVRDTHLHVFSGDLVFFVYYKSIKGKVNHSSRRLLLECRCDERLKTKAEGSTRLAYTGWRDYHQRKIRWLFFLI